MHILHMYPFRFLITAWMVVLLTGCGKGPPEGANAISGSVRIDGSSTVFPINEAVAEEFMLEHPYVRVTVGVSGTGGGFSRFLRGETDINSASRPIDPHEQAIATENRIDFIELPISYDGLALVVSKENDWIDCITTRELRAIWEPNSKITHWSHVRPSFPNVPLRLYGPGTDSGTYDYFTRVINGAQGASRVDYTASEDDNVLVQGIKGDPYALGFFGLAYYENNTDKLKLIAVKDEGKDNSATCMYPTLETIQNGRYRPLSRPEFLYINAARAEAPEVQTFIKFYLDNAPQLVAEVGFVPLSAPSYAMAWDRYATRSVGTLFGTDEHGMLNVDYVLSRALGSPDSLQLSHQD